MNRIKIDLEKEPKCLKDLRDNGNSYSALKDDCLKETRKILFSEQNSLCAYCEQKFKSEVHIEHYISQSEDPSKVLSFDNFLGICSGREYFDPKKSPKHIAHCGNNRGSIKLNLNPKNQDHIDWIYYDENAAIKSTCETHNTELNDILNLNFETLRKKRNNVYKRNLSNLIKASSINKWSKEETFNKAIATLAKSNFEFKGYLKFRYREQINPT